MDACPSDDILVEFAVGSLSADDRTEVESHCRNCSVCQRKLPTIVGAKEGNSPSEFDFGPPTECGPMGNLGRFHVISELGRGGMGAVFRARDEALDRDVALKVMLPSVASTEESRERFRREARAMAALQHDHVIPVYEVSESTPYPYLAMPLLNGESLEARLRSGRIQQVEKVREILDQVCDGLHAAHQSGLIHRDIKPSNIWLEAETDRVRILDFGLAYVADADSGLSADGQIKGTPSYMSPEQVRGHRVDHRSDLFSLGCVLYSLLTGRNAFYRENIAATLFAVVNESPRAIGSHIDGIPDDLVRLTSDLLQKDPQLRPQSVLEVRERLKSPERKEAQKRVPPSSGTMPRLFLEVSPIRSGILVLRGSSGAENHELTSGSTDIFFAQTEFHPEVAADISRNYAEMMELNHGRRPAADRVQRHSPEAIANSLRVSILRDKVGSEFDRFLEKHAADGLELVISGVPRILNLPWELLRFQKEFVTLYFRNVRIVRRSGEAALSVRTSRPQLGGVCRILFAAAQPSDLPRVEWQDVLHEFNLRTWYWQDSGQLQVITVAHPAGFNTLEAIRDLAQHNQFHAIFLLAHGRAEPSPAVGLVGPAGEAEWVEVNRLIPAISQGEQLPSVLLLGCCHLSRSDEQLGSVAEAAAKMGIDVVVSMQSAVSVEGAAVAAGSVFESFLEGNTVGQATHDCRHSLLDHESAGGIVSEWSLPVTWLAPGRSSLVTPFPRMIPTEGELISDLENAIVLPTITMTDAESALARLRLLCKAKTATLVDSSVSRYTQYLGEVFVGTMENGLRRLQQVENRTESADLLVRLERHPELADNEVFRGYREWVTEPIRSLITQGIRSEVSDWQAAEECFFQAISWYRRLESQDDYCLKRVCSRAYHRAVARWHHAKGQQQLNSAEASLACGALSRCAAELSQTLECFQAIPETHVAGLEATVSTVRSLLGTVEWQLTVNRCLADEQLTEAEDLLAAETDERHVDPEWVAYVGGLASAGRMRQRIDELLRDGHWRDARRRVEVMINRVLPRLAGKQVSNILRWCIPAEIVDTEQLPTELSEMAAQLAAWPQHQREALAEVLNDLNQTQRYDDALITLSVRGGVQLEADCPVDVAECFQPTGLTEDSVQALSQHLRTRGSDDILAVSQQVLGDAWIGFLALSGECGAAERELKKRIAAGTPYELALHQLAVGQLIHCLKNGETPVEAWRFLQTAWCTLLGRTEFWIDWVRMHGDVASSAGRSIDDRAEILVAGVREQLAALVYRSAPEFFGIFDAAAGWFRDRSVEYQQLALMLSISSRSLMDDHLTETMNLWNLAIDRAGQTDHLRGTTFQILRLAQDRLDCWPDLKNAEQLDERIQFSRAVLEVLTGTDRESDIGGVLVEALVQRGLQTIGFWHSEQVRHALEDFSEAYRVRQDAIAAVALSACLAVTARLSSNPREKQRLSDEALRILAEAAGKTTSSSLLKMAMAALTSPATVSDVEIETVLHEVEDSMQVSLVSRVAELLDEDMPLNAMDAISDLLRSGAAPWNQLRPFLLICLRRLSELVANGEMAMTAVRPKLRRLKELIADDEGILQLIAGMETPEQENGHDN